MIIKEARNKSKKYFLSLIIFGAATLLLWQPLQATDAPEKYHGGDGSGYSSVVYSLPGYTGGGGNSAIMGQTPGDVKIGYSAATKLSVTTPAETYVDKPLNSPPVVNVLDENNNLVQDAEIAVTLSLIDMNTPLKGGVLKGTTTLTTQAGVANFSTANLSVNNVGFYKIQASSSSGLAGISSQFEIRTPTPLVTSPNGGEEFSVGTIIPITWEVGGDYNGSFNVEYTTDGTNWFSIGTTEPNVLTYNWTIPLDGSYISRTYLVRVTAIDDGITPHAFDESNDAFSILGGFTINEPKSTYIWSTKNPHTINWATNPTGGIANVNLFYSTTGCNDRWYAITMADHANRGSFDWTPPSNTASTSACIRVEDASENSAPATCDDKFIIQDITLTSPTLASIWSIGANSTIAWTSVGVNSVVIEWSSNDFAVDGLGNLTAGGTIANNVTSNSLPSTNNYQWTIPNDFTPSDNIKIRVRSVTHDSEPVDGEGKYKYAEGKSANFKIKGSLTVTAPANDTLKSGEPAHIAWTTAKGTIAKVKIDYTDGGWAANHVWPVINETPNTGSYDLWVPLITGTTIQVRVTDFNSSSTYDDSDYFTVTGMQVNKPAEGAILLAGSAATNNITWMSQGIPLVNLYYSIDSGVTWDLIQSKCTNNNAYTWTVPTNATVNNLAQIKVTDWKEGVPPPTPTIIGLSQKFSIAPQFTITQPVSAEVLNVGDTKTITWTTQGMADKVKLEYSSDNGSTWNSVLDSNGNNADNYLNSGSFAWKVPDKVTSSALIRITDVTPGHPVLLNANTFQSAVFKIKTTFSIANPMLDDKLLVGAQQVIIWTSSGSSSVTKLEYATDYADDNYTQWQVIATTASNPGTNRYVWNQVPDVVSNPLTATSSPNYDPNALVPDGKSLLGNPHYRKVKIRISDLGPGAPESISYSGIFEARWLQTYFMAIDSGNNTVSTALNFTCKSAGVDIWPAPAIDYSGCFRYFKNGSYLVKITTNYGGNPTASGDATFFTDPNYYTWGQTQIFGDIYGDLKVTAEIQTGSDVQYVDSAHAVFSYDPASDQVNIHAWMERSGKIRAVGTYLGCTITIYNSSNQAIATLNKAAYDTNGIYNLSWDLKNATDINRLGSYLGKVSINTSGAAYSTSQVFDIATPYNIQQESKFREDTTKTLADQAGTLTTQFGAMNAQFGTVQNKLDTIKEAVGSTLPAQIDAVNTNLTATAADVTSILQDTGTTIPNSLDSIQGLVVSQGALTAIEKETAKGVKAKIIDMNKNIDSGNATTIKYKTQSGLSPTVDIYSPNNTLLLSGQKMVEIGSTGLYEYKVPFSPDWGTGEFTAICSEATKSSMDSILLNVQSPEIKADTANLMKKIDSIDDGLNKIISKGLSRRGGIKTDSGFGYEKQIKELGANSGYQSLVQTIVNPITARAGAGAGAGGEGEGVGAGAASDADYQNYIKQLRVVTDLLKELVQKKSDQPVVKTWYEQGSIKIKMVAVNPSETEKHTITVESYLPKEIVPADIMKLADLNLVFDYDRSLYKVFKEATLASKETKVFEIEMNDIWQIPADELKTYKDYVEEMDNILAKGDYAKLARELTESIKQRIARIEESQVSTLNKPEEHIAAFRANKTVMTSINLDVLTLEKIVSQTGSQLKSSIVKKIDPSLLLATMAEDTNEMRDVKLFLAVSNPSEVEKEVDIKRYLPKGIEKDNVIDAGGLSISYDPDKELYYLSKEVKLKSKEDLAFQIKIKDIWFVSGRIVDNLRQHTRKLVGQLTDTEYEAVATRVFNDIDAKLKSIIKSQDDTMEKVDDHIATFYLNQERLDQIKDEILRLERMVLSVGGNIEYLSNVTKIAKYDKGRDFKESVRPLFRMETPKKGTFLKIIFIIIGFLGVISFLFYALWWSQIKKKS